MNLPNPNGKKFSLSNVKTISHLTFWLFSYYTLWCFGSYANIGSPYLGKELHLHEKQKTLLLSLLLSIYSLCRHMSQSTTVCTRINGFSLPFRTLRTEFVEKDSRKYFLHKDGLVFLNCQYLIKYLSLSRLKKGINHLTWHSKKCSMLSFFFNLFLHHSIMRVWQDKKNKKQIWCSNFANL